MLLGKKLKAAREEANLFITNAATISAVPVSVISDVENGHIKNPSIKVIVRLCVVYGCPIEKLIDDEITQQLCGF